MMMAWFEWLKSRPSAEDKILQAILQGWSLRSHRKLDGEKQYCLHALTGETEDVLPKVVQSLRKKRLIETNHKFPTATYLLTGRGAAVARDLLGTNGQNPLTSRDFVRD